MTRTSAIRGPSTASSKAFEVRADLPLAPGPVNILQIGRNEAEGWFYYVMELADGVPQASDSCSIQKAVAAH